MSDFLHNIETAVKAVLIDGLPTLQVLTRDTEEIRGTQAVVIKAEITQEFVPGSRIFEISLDVDVRSNRNEHDADETGTTFQDVFATLCNTNPAELTTSAARFLSWFVQGTSGAWAEDVSVKTIRIRTHSIPLE